jgi:hypothetical protein
MAAAGHPADTALVTLRLERGCHTISGTLNDEDGVERRFWGWLELSAALDRARGAEPAAASSSRLERGL